MLPSRAERIEKSRDWSRFNHSNTYKNFHFDSGKGGGGGVISSILTNLVLKYFFFFPHLLAHPYESQEGSGYLYGQVDFGH